MPEIPPEDLLLVGKVIRLHGLTGLLRIWSYTESEATFTDVEAVFLEPSTGGFHPFEIEAIRPHKNIFLMKLNGLTSLERVTRVLYSCTEYGRGASGGRCRQPPYGT